MPESPGTPIRAVLFARYPEAGKAKTRLIPALGPEGAAEVHRRLTERTVATLRRAGIAIELRFTGATEGEFGQWLGNSLDYVEQGAGDLGKRMARAADNAPVILLGSDCPDLQVHHIEQAVEALVRGDIVIGPAEDGGYWLLGLPQSFPFLFSDMQWGTDKVLAETLARLEADNIEPVLLETLADCDRPEDLERWPDLAR